MEDNYLYEDIAKRTDGDIYVGVVGPVRTGKSTFIKRFMDLLVIPNIDNEFKKERAKDELPQSAGGRTIMTTEPKFIPNEAVEVTLGNQIHLNVRMIDCVGYLVNNAIGYLEDEMPRMVKTPWAKDEIPFEEAAEIGTRKVILEHSTIGILVTTDGSVTDIPREDYIKAEERVVNELKEIKKPFIILLNSINPDSEETRNLANRLQEKYDTQVVPTDCENLDIEKIEEIFGRILYEFPIEQININFPSWVDALPEDHWLKEELYDEIKGAFRSSIILKQVDRSIIKLQNTDVISTSSINDIQLGIGSINMNISLYEELFYKVLTELSGVDITDEMQLFSTMISFANTKKEYDKIEYALQQVKTKGYGIVNPGIDELILEEPEMVKQGSRYGVKLKAKAPSIHLIRADIETEVSPIVGSERQSQDLVESLLSEFENDPKRIWESNIFGKSLHELVNEGLQNKLSHMPEEAQIKLKETLERIVNEGSGGLICIIL